MPLRPVIGLHINRTPRPLSLLPKLLRTHRLMITMPADQVPHHPRSPPPDRRMRPRRTRRLRQQPQTPRNGEPQLRTPRAGMPTHTRLHNLRQGMHPTTCQQAPCNQQHRKVSACGRNRRPRLGARQRHTINSCSNNSKSSSKGNSNNNTNHSSNSRATVAT